MDKSAIQQIQNTGNAPEFIKQLEHIGFPVAALPQDYDLHNLEKYMPHRNQLRGTMRTNHINEFVKYHEEHLSEGTQCFIQPDDMTAKTIFDIGTLTHPGHCVHQAVIALKATAPFSALLSVNDKRQGQKELAEWIEDYAENLQIFTSSGEVIESAVASAAIRNMKFEVKTGRESTVDDFSQHQSEYESMAVKTMEEFPMPAVFKFTCVPYLGLPERKFEMRMSTIGNEVLILRIKKIEQHTEEMGEEFQAILIEKFKSKDLELETFIGSFSG